MAHQPDDVRDVVLIGAGGAGKTTLAEALLHRAKATSRRGSVEDGNTVMDWDDEEKERKARCRQPAHQAASARPPAM